MVSKLFQNVGTAKTFKETGGDVLFTPKNIATGAGRLSDRCDLGAWPAPRLFRWFAETKPVATPTVGNKLDIYYAGWDADTPASPVGGVGAADAAFNTSNDLLNLRWLGSVICSNASSAVFQAGGLVLIPYRYVSIVWWNGFGATLTNTAGDHFFRITPFIAEQQ